MSSPTSAQSPPATLSAFDLALYALVVLVWGSSWFAMRWQVGEVAAEVSVMWRFAISFPLMFLWAWAAGDRLLFPLRTHLWFVATGVSMFSVNLVLFYNATLLIPTGLVAVVFSLASLFNMALSAIFFGQRPDLRLAVAGVMGVTGVGLMFVPEIAARGMDGGALAGLLVSAVATLCFCTGNMLSLGSRRHGASILAGAAWGMLYGTGFLLIVVLMRGQPLTVEWTVRYWGALIYLATVSSVVAFTAYLTLVVRIGAARAGYMTVLFPAVALAISTLLEGYQWTVLAVAGLALVAAGNVVMLRGTGGGATGRRT